VTETPPESAKPGEQQAAPAPAEKAATPEAPEQPEVGGDLDQLQASFDRRLKRQGRKNSKLSKENETLNQKLAAMQTQLNGLQANNLRSDLEQMDLPDDFDDWSNQRQHAFFASEAVKRSQAVPQSATQPVDIGVSVQKHFQLEQQMVQFNPEQRELIEELGEQHSLSVEQAITLARGQDPELFQDVGQGSRPDTFVQGAFAGGMPQRQQAGMSKGQVAQLEQQAANERNPQKRDLLRQKILGAYRDAHMKGAPIR